jgi:hypothetical protein
VTLGQLILDLPHRATHGAEDFLVSGCSDRRFARTPSALVAADAENSHAEDFPALGIHQHLSAHFAFLLGANILGSIAGSPQALGKDLQLIN